MNNLTPLGKFLRKLRIDHDERGCDMANRLGVSTAFLSKVEHGKAKPPVGWEDAIIQAYQLPEEQQKELKTAIREMRTVSVIDVIVSNKSDKELALLFMRSLPDLTMEQRQQLWDILR